MIEHLFPPCGTGYIVALRAYFDASIKDNDIIAVSGVAFGMKGAKKATNKWRKVMGDRVFHMTDLHNKKKEFSDIRDGEGGEILKALVPILNRHAKYFVSVSMSIKELSEFLPVKSSDDIGEQVIRGFKNPYSYCTQYAMYSIAMLSKSSGRSSPIHYVFETGDDGQKSSKSFVEGLSAEGWEGFAKQHLIGGVTYSGKDSVHTLLQASDFLAWEWSRYIQRHPDKMRPPLHLMLGDNEGKFNDFGMSVRNKRVSCTHFTGENIKRNLRNMVDQHNVTTLPEKFEILKTYASEPRKAAPLSIFR